MRKSKEIFMSYGFCQQMVTETLSYYNFRYNHFMKLARGFSQYIKSCDENGFFNRKAHLKYEQKFFRQKEIFDQIQDC